MRSLSKYIVGVNVIGAADGSRLGGGVTGSTHWPFWHVPIGLELHGVPSSEFVDSAGHDPS